MTALDPALLSIPQDAAYRPFAELLRDRRLIVYGAGGLYASFDSFVLQRFGLRPDLLIDRKFLDGAAAGQISPDAFFSEGWKRFSPGDLVLVCLGESALHAEIRQRFADIGFTDVRAAYEIYEYNLVYAGEDFARDPLALYHREWDKLVHVHGLLRDDLSRTISFQ